MQGTSQSPYLALTSDHHLPSPVALTPLVLASLSPLMQQCPLRVYRNLSAATRRRSCWWRARRRRYNIIRINIIRFTNIRIYEYHILPSFWRPRPAQLVAKVAESLCVRRSIVHLDVPAGVRRQRGARSGWRIGKLAASCSTYRFVRVPTPAAHRD